MKIQQEIDGYKEKIKTLQKKRKMKRLKQETLLLLNQKKMKALKQKSQND